MPMPHHLCPRCGAHLHLRKPNSLARTWALVCAAIIFYIPANVLPMTITSALGSQAGRHHHQRGDLFHAERLLGDRAGDFYRQRLCTVRQTVYSDFPAAQRAVSLDLAAEGPNQPCTA